ncbi:MAG: DUF1292 domain-containing protein [Lachnospiraceae bacterium]|nr:DUF1292 domain-containing protein [Lachnospiraceae bacterium]
MEKIKLTADGEEIELTVLEQTRIAGKDYLLATEDGEDDGEGEVPCYILRAVKTEGEDIIYEFVEEDDELEYISKIFEELLEDTEIRS